MKKGKTNNPNGRPKGAKNKVTAPLREMITDFLNDNFDEVQSEFMNLDPKDKLKVYTDLLQYAVPKLRSVEVKDEFDKLTDEQLDQIINELKVIQNGQK